MCINKGYDFIGIIFYGCKRFFTFCVTIQYWQDYMVIFLK